MSNSEQRLFSDLQVIGELEPEEIATTLRDMGDEETADEIVTNLDAGAGRENLFGFGSAKPWQHINHKLGFISVGDGEQGDKLEIRDVANIEPDDLLNKRVNVHLDQLYTHDYPGRGEHHVMLTFKGQNQAPDGTEEVSFSRTFRARDGQSVAAIGYPVFIGLKVGGTGVALNCFTVNVKNSADEAFLSVLDSAPFSQGLQLLETAQPAIKPFTAITLGVTKMIAGRNKNVPVQDCYLGLDTSNVPGGCRIAIGNYVAVQVPSLTEVDWKDWEYDRTNGLIVTKDGGLPLPYNYLVFRITPFNAES